VPWNSISFLALIFLAVILFLAGSMLFWNTLWGSNAAIIKRRLRTITGELSLENQSLVKTRFLSPFPWLHKALQMVPHIHSVDVFMTQAGLVMTVGHFLMYQMLMVLAGAFLASVLGVGLGWVCLLSILPTLSWLFYLQHKRRDRVAQIEAQLPDTLDLMARAMQAGHAFSSALLIVGSDGTQPIRGEFQSTFDEINFGISTSTALHHLTMRVASSDLRFLWWRC
jgi:tight adherence protein B